MNIDDLIKTIQKPPYLWVAIGVAIIIGLSIISSIWRSILNSIGQSKRNSDRSEADPAEFQKLKEYTSFLASTKYQNFLLSVQEKDETMLLITKLLPENQRHLGYKLLKAAQTVVEDNSEAAKIELERAATAMQMYLDAEQAIQ